METIEKIMTNLSAADIDNRLEEQLIDGILYAFQEQTTEDAIMLNGFGTCGQHAWQARESLFTSDLRHHLVAHEQQVGQSASTGG